MKKVRKISHHKAVRHLRQSDKRMARLIEKVGPCLLVPDSEQTPFHALVRSIVYQQLSGKAAASILNKVKSLYPDRVHLTAEDILATPEEKLRKAGLSGAKTRALKDLSQKCLEGIVPTFNEISSMDDEEIIERLCQVRGVGRWTVEMLLIFNLGRMDIWPVTDYGVRKGFALIYKKKELPTPKELHTYGEKWKPFRSVAAWYLWRSLDSKPKKSSIKK